MHRYTESRKSPFKAQQIYDLVADIEKYPEFLPWAVQANILEKKDNDIKAKLVIQFKTISDSYVSSVKLLKNEINVVQISGPFSKLNNNWKFTDTEDGCRIDFDIEFSFKSKILNMLIGVFFERATRKMVSAFEKRAKEIYSENAEIS
jgi:coenzyme Q-binding protein COQ10